MYCITVLVVCVSVCLCVSVCVSTVFGGDVTDDIDLIHGNLPVGFLLTEAQRPALLPVAGVTLHTQEHGALDTQHNMTTVTAAHAR